MARSTKDDWLQGPSDLREADVHDVPVPGKSVRVRGLPAAYSNQAVSEALEYVQGRGGEQTTRINTQKLEVLQFVHGVIEPSFSPEDAQVIATRFGPAFQKVVAKIDELSGVDKEAIEKANTSFPAGGSGESGPDLVDATPAGSS